MPKGKDVSPSDRFAFNSGFTCNLARIKVMQVAARVESVKEREETEVMVEEERKHQIEVSGDLKRVGEGGKGEGGRGRGKMIGSGIRFDD